TCTPNGGLHRHQRPRRGRGRATQQRRGMSTGKQRSLGGCLGAWAAGMAAVLASWGAQGQADVEFDEAFLRSPVDIRMFSQETLMTAGAHSVDVIVYVTCTVRLINLFRV